ncbi:Scr1 family TA system antitoxin-like transcriptional regulator [Kitasatospora purpeofusca]|uniref:helix-turn-helix domain-containing protein n=1 Tax=Kitasatospora purpeofusca TaxID=67352 RepID=UPI0036EBED6D
MNRKKLDPQSSPRAAFGLRLRTSREALKLTQGQLGHLIGYSDTHISAVETALKSPTLEFARRCDEALGLEGTLETMWWGLKATALLDGFPEHAAQESRAARIRVFEANIIPGLLQTIPYAAALASAAVRRGRITKIQADERLKFLSNRQRLLARSEAPLFHAVLDESCIRRPIGGPEVMKEQLAHLEDVSASSRIIIQLSPFGLGEEAPFRVSMTLLSFADRTVVGYSESLERGYVVRTPGTVAAWEEDYHRLQVEALSKRASQEMIRKAREDLTL